ncbi:leishmanolysin-related zinc metalloendopeptidase [Candidatus Palauibacter sp.]|uniref:leishmanolysin-related zinc metalloendopeptidase n=1 Tax=Candidatus Palauibacter sp. TaxID=3101350 RepID=UPI003AF20471
MVVGTGDIQISLSWDSDADLDLHVVEPSGEEIYYRNSVSQTGGTLDLDSNSACRSTQPRNENTTWPVGRAPTGTYVVRVNHWSNCGAGLTNYVVRVIASEHSEVHTGSFTGRGNGGGRGSGITMTTFSFGAGGNRGPLAVGAIPADTIEVGASVTRSLSSYFSDPDGDQLTYAVATSNSSIGAVSISGSTLTVTGVGPGTATVTVTARDPGNLIARQAYHVTVTDPDDHGNSIETATTVAIGDTVPGVLTTEDEDFFEITVPRHRFPLRAFTQGNTDTYGYLLDHDGSEIASDDDSGEGRNFHITRELDAGTYYLRVRGYFGATGSYSLIVGSGAPPPPPPDGFRIDLVLASYLTAAQESVFRGAAERWMTVLAATELPDYEAREWSCGDDSRFNRYAAIDDVMIVAVVEEIDGPGGTLASAGPCWTRRGGLPIYGRMSFDAADLRLSEQMGYLDELVLHEMGHVLGIGTIWDDFELLRNPASVYEAPDTHFTGPLAIAAFDEAGGTRYAGAKVPVENTGGEGTWNGHWREAVMEAELMTGWAEEGGTEPLRAITIQSLADLGYAVDATVADYYRLPSADAARKIEKGRLIPYGNDIWRGPIVVADSAGRVVRVIRPR